MTFSWVQWVAYRSVVASDRLKPVSSARAALSARAPVGYDPPREVGMRAVAWKLPMTIIILLATLASSASAQTILIYDENTTNMRAIDAATRLGLTFTRGRAADFNTLLRGSRWDLVIVDMPSTEPSGMWQAAIVDHIAAGGRAIHTQWQSASLGGLGAAYQVTVGLGHDTLPFYRWSMDSLFTTPQVVPDRFTMIMDLWVRTASTSSP
jgi:hypothetical protein